MAVSPTSANGGLVREGPTREVARFFATCVVQNTLSTHIDYDRPISAAVSTISFIYANLQQPYDPRIRASLSTSGVIAAELSTSIHLAATTTCGGTLNASLRIGKTFQSALQATPSLTATIGTGVALQTWLVPAGSVQAALTTQVLLRAEINCQSIIRARFKSTFEWDGTECMFVLRRVPSLFVWSER